MVSSFEPEPESLAEPSPERTDFLAEEPQTSDQNPPEVPEDTSEENDALFWQRMMFYMVYLELKKPDIRTGLIAAALEQLRQAGRDWEEVLRGAEKLSGKALDEQQRSEVYEMMRDFAQRDESSKLGP